VSGGWRRRPLPAASNLSRLLTNEANREKAISFVASSRAERIPLLLNLTKTAPRGIDEHDLHVGLADAFGALKVTDAIPFLLLNITLRRDAFIDLRPWLKTAQATEQSFPSVAALISMGPTSSRAAMRAYDQATTPEERLAIVFVVSRIRSVPEARAFLSAVVGRADLERSFAQEGMKTVIQ
jgi:hypothetical protein